MEPLTKEEILSSFPQKLRKKVKLSHLELDKINWENLDFLGWIHPSGHLGYLVYPFPQGPRGLVLERTQLIRTKGVRMCSFCYILHPASGVRLFTYRIPNKRITVGNYFCADLQCSLYIRKIKNNNIAQLNESLTIEQKIERLRKNIEKFFALIDGKIYSKI